MKRRFTTSRRPGFTLLEAMMAVAILLLIVVSVTSAITAGQQHAFEARQRIAATLACEELLGRIVTDSYLNLPSWHGFTEAAGTMTTANGSAYPPSFNGIGRTVEVSTTLQVLSNPAVTIRGQTIRVTAVDHEGNSLVDLERFVPEPAGS